MRYLARVNGLHSAYLLSEDFAPSMLGSHAVAEALDGQGFRVMLNLRYVTVVEEIGAQKYPDFVEFVESLAAQCAGAPA